MVEGDSLENCCAPWVPWVRILLPPPFLYIHAYRQLKSYKFKRKSVMSHIDAFSHTDAFCEDAFDWKTFDTFCMNLCLEQAYLARANDEVPVGALVVYAPRNRETRKLVAPPRVISFGRNRREELQDPSAHAEFLAMEKASRRLGTWRLQDCIVYVTLEPCVMCAGLMVQSRIARCVYGAADGKGGGITSLYQIGTDARLNHVFRVTSGVREQQCRAILHDYFAGKRKRVKLIKNVHAYTCAQYGADKKGSSR